MAKTGKLIPMKDPVVRKRFKTNPNILVVLPFQF